MALEVTAAVEFLLVDPIELDIQQRRATPSGEAPRGTPAGPHEMQVVVAHERDPSSVRTEGGDLLGHCVVGQSARRPGPDIVVVEVVGPADQQGVVAGAQLDVVCQQVASLLGRESLQCGQGLDQCFCVEQGACLVGLHVDLKGRSEGLFLIWRSKEEPPVVCPLETGQR